MTKNMDDDIFKIDDIVDEYNLASDFEQEHQKVKWATEEGMLNRYDLVLNNINWDPVNSWLDVGCGTAGLLTYIEKEKDVYNYTGIDISDKLISYAKTKSFKTNVIKLFCQDFMQFITGEPFDLVTSIGVLQKCGIPLKRAIVRLASLIKEGGQLFITTKNKDWIKFKTEGFKPYEGHNWFNLSDIREAFFEAGLIILDLKGFEPRLKGFICEPEESHSIFVYATK